MGKEEYVVLVAGGSPNDWPELSQKVKAKAKWIGIDRGALYLVEKGITPQIAVGDFDSLMDSEFQQVQQHALKVYQSASEKDDTDTQLALQVAVETYPNAKCYILIGGTHGRIDHFLANFWLPLEPRFQKYSDKIKLMDQQNTISYFLPGTYKIRKEQDKKYIAFVALTSVKSLNLMDLKYELHGGEMKQPTSLASNEFIGKECQFSFQTGVICVIQSRDK